jgi:putative ABC transport system permease protein
LFATCTAQAAVSTKSAGVKNLAIEKISWSSGDRQKVLAEPGSPVRTFKKPFTIYWAVFLLSLQNLRANKLRTALTLLGIVVGVAAIISVVTIIEGLNQSVASTFAANGSTVFTLSKSPSIITSREEMIKVNKRKDITRDDADAVTRLCRSCWRVGYSGNSRANVKHGENSADDVAIRGMTLSGFEIENINIEAGRSWTEKEGEAGQYVAVVGSDIIKNLFNDAAPGSVIGQEVRIRGVTYRVIGTIAPLGSIFGISRDNVVIIPFQTALKTMPIRRSLMVNIQVRDAADMENARDEVTTIMRARRGKFSGSSMANGEEEDEGFTVESSDVFISLYQTATDNIYLVTLGVSAISLVVGGIVVMNIMLVSVVERTKEIGLRKAVGARRRDILRQFLFEAVTIASVGGVIGVFTGFALAYLISYLIGFPVLISYWSVLMGVSVSSIVGIVSGIYPAWKAAALNPVEAMRRE